MNINKKSWHFKVWSEFTNHKSWQGDANLCEYTRTVFIKAPACCLALVVIGSCVVVTQLVVSIPALILGFRPGLKEFWGNNDPQFLVRYEGLKIPRKLPKLPFELYPWHVLVPLAIAYLQWAPIHYFGWYWTGLIEGGVLFIFGIMLAAAYLHENGDSETLRLLKAKAEAKHRMICPLITFTEEPTSTNPEE